MSRKFRFLFGLKFLLPSPFTIGILLTGIVFVAAFLLNISEKVPNVQYIIRLADYWYKGIWELLEFAMQMVLMLLLGHVIALSTPLIKFIDSILNPIDTTKKAALFISFFTIVVSLLNWGLGLIFGAIMARKVAEKFQKEQKSLNYPLVAACGYVGMMVWHCGLSGSAPLKVADKGHFLEHKIGIIPFEQTIFSPMNGVVIVLLLIIIPVSMFFVANNSVNNTIALNVLNVKIEKNEMVQGAEKIDHNNWFGTFIGGFILLYAIGIGVNTIYHQLGFSFLNTNYVNTLLLGIAILLHRNISHFIFTCTEAVSGTIGIILLFPIYAGIMGIMKYSGLTVYLSEFFIMISDKDTLPIYTLLSSGLVNIFIPSGGGQWAVQGEIIVKAAQELNSSVSKNIMALAYGDQLTNMLQPFWALPLLGITKLKAQQIFPYTLLLFGVGFFVFALVLFLF